MQNGIPPWFLPEDVCVMNLNKNVWKYGQTTTDEEHNTITWAQNTGKNPPPQARGTTIEIWSIIFFKKGRNMGTIAVRSFFPSQLSISWKKLSYRISSSTWGKPGSCNSSHKGEVLHEKPHKIAVLPHGEKFILQNGVVTTTISIRRKPGKVFKNTYTKLHAATCC